MNLKIREFKQTLTSYINSVDLPIEVKSIVLEDISRQVSYLSTETIKQELAAQEKENKAEDAEETKGE